MTLDMYIEGLCKFRDSNPESGKLEVITAKDDEGNGYNRIHYEPNTTHFDGTDTYHPDDIKEQGRVSNAVVVN